MIRPGESLVLLEVDASTESFPPAREKVRKGSTTRALEALGAAEAAIDRLGGRVEARSAHGYPVFVVAVPTARLADMRVPACVHVLGALAAAPVPDLPDP